MFHDIFCAIFILRNSATGDRYLNIDRQCVSQIQWWTKTDDIACARHCILWCHFVINFLALTNCLQTWTWLNLVKFWCTIQLLSSHRNVERLERIDRIALQILCVLKITLFFLPVKTLHWRLVVCDREEQFFLRCIQSMKWNVERWVWFDLANFDESAVTKTEHIHCCREVIFNLKTKGK